MQPVSDMSPCHILLERFCVSIVNAIPWLLYKNTANMLSLHVVQKAVGLSLHDPRNIILMQKRIETRFDSWEWTIVPEGADVFRVNVGRTQLQHR